MLLKDRGSLLSAESQYRDQLTERITLLLTISQYMHKILGIDKTPMRTTFDRYLLNPKLNTISFTQKKRGQAETKPFMNFSVFHNHLITQLKALSQNPTRF